MQSLWKVRAMYLALLTVIVGGMLSVASSVAADAGAMKFKVRIDNISQGNVLTLSTGGAAPFAVSPGVWLVHTTPAPVFKSGEADRGQGLEAQAEDGNPAALAKALAKQAGVKAHGVFNTPVGASKPGAIGPGGAYKFEVTAAPGMRFTFVAMFGQSNDLFYAPPEEGTRCLTRRASPSVAISPTRSCSGMPAPKATRSQAPDQTRLHGSRPQTQDL